MQASPPPSAQVLPEVADTMPDRRPRVAMPAAVEPDEASHPAAGVQPARPRAERPAHDGLDDGLQPVMLRQASRETSGASAGADSTPEEPEVAPEVVRSNATAIPRRPVVEGSGRSRTDVPWLGIISWLLLCGALFASLLGWPSQAALDRVTELWSQSFAGTILAGRPASDAPVTTQTPRSSAQKQDWSNMAPGALPQDLQKLPPIELAPPIRSDPAGETVERAPDGPPVPRFKPHVDRVAAKFSNAFFEIGDHLQQQGDFDGAIHMRRQAANLSPWKPPSTSDL